MRSNDRTPHLWLVAFLVLAAILASGYLHLPQPATPVRPIAQRKPMPAIVLPQLGGGVWSLADHRGQVVLLDKQGRIAKTYSGATPRTAFARDLATLQAEP